MVQLLPAFRLPGQNIHALTSARLQRASKVRRFIDFVEEAVLAAGTHFLANFLTV